MNKFQKFTLVFSVITILFLVPVLSSTPVFAQTKPATTTTTKPAQKPATTTTTKPATTTTGTQGSSGTTISVKNGFDTTLGTFFDPLGGLTLPGLIVRIINILLMISGIVSLIFIIVGGIQLVTSTGSEGRILKGKQTIIYAVAGLIVSILSFSIVAIVQSIIS